MLLTLRYYGDPCLRKKCLPIEKINEEIQGFAKDLIETLLHFDGAGLSAPQVGNGHKIFVVRYANGKDSEGGPIVCEPSVHINPSLSNPSKDQVTSGEGCLSIPGIYAGISRPRAIDVTYMDLQGRSHRERVTDWRARVIMHENDHLNGVLHVDRLPLQKKSKIKHLLTKIKKKYPSSH